jgi:hypothetical protein
MIISSRESLIATCPELYGELYAAKLPDPSGVSRLGGVVLKRIASDSEAWTNSVLMEYAHSPAVVKPFAIKDETLYMPYIEGTPCTLPFDDSLRALSEEHEELVESLVATTREVSTTVSDSLFLVHGDYGLNNIIASAEGLRVIDWEHAYFSEEPKDRFANIAALSCRTWFHATASLELVRRGIGMDPDGLDALEEAIARKKRIGVAYYAKHQANSHTRIDAVSALEAQLGRLQSYVEDCRRTRHTVTS